MSFETDKQTINDLELFEKVKGEKSVISLFNHTKSIGGKGMLEKIFRSPLNNIELIEKRIDTIKFFHLNPDFIEINKEWLDFIEYYLRQKDKPVKYSAIGSLYKSLRNKIKPDNATYVAIRGIKYLTIMLNELYDFFQNLPKEKYHGHILSYRNTILDSISGSTLKEVLKFKSKGRFSAIENGRLDYCFRYTEIQKVWVILDLVYEVDALKAVSLTVQNAGFVFPTFKSSDSKIDIHELYHPFLKEPISNNLILSEKQNICFLTGPNMAGKSTYLKAFGISMYLAHLGSPVPAKSMETSVFNGLFTTINLADNINNGYSHFYNEVLRVKHVAERIGNLGKIVVVFDELFRGTNVKDAYEASLSVISSFAKLKTSAFAISTHIIEIAEHLKQTETVDFKYFEITLTNDIPKYTYSLKDGVSNERIGMYILKKEKVIETIEKYINNEE